MGDVDLPTYHLLRTEMASGQGLAMFAWFSRVPLVYSGAKQQSVTLYRSRPCPPCLFRSPARCWSAANQHFGPTTRNSGIHPSSSPVRSRSLSQHGTRAAAKFCDWRVWSCLLLCVSPVCVCVSRTRSVEKPLSERVEGAAIRRQPKDEPQTNDIRSPFGIPLTVIGHTTQ